MSSVLSDKAWEAQDKAQLYRGQTKVGCALQTEDYRVWTGANIEMPFNHGIHAEVAAIISAMRFDPATRIRTMLIAAPRPCFTPCGACMDWIMWFGEHETQIIHEYCPGQESGVWDAGNLMPHYPR